MQDKKGYGRIYRIAPAGKKLALPKYDLTNTTGQLEAFKCPAINVRYSGFEKLKQQGSRVVEPVRLLLNDENPFIRARAVWLLAQLGSTGITEAEKVLQHADPQLRATAYRALRQIAPDFIPYAKQLAGDTSAFVRREVAVSLQHLPYEKTKPILLELIKQYDGEDRWYLETLGAVLQGHESQMYSELKKYFADGKPANQWNKQMATLAWRLHPPEAVPDLALRANDTTLPAADRAAAVTALAFINHKNAARTMVALAKSTTADVAQQAAYWLSFRQSNDWYALLDWSTIGINTAYERKLAQMKVKQGIVMDNRQSLDERKWRAQEMAADSVGGQLLIGLAADNKLDNKVVPFVEESIFKNPDPGVRVQAGNYFKKPGAAKRYSIQQISKMPSDANAGKKVFTSYCASCHKSGVEGGDIGPDLTAIGQKFGTIELLDAIINPSAAIVFGYEPWRVNTTEGTSVYGFLLSENKQNLVLKDLAGQKHVLPVNKIASKEKQQQSLMPDPVTNGLSEQNLADVAAYLSSQPGRISQQQ
jgi:putative heme-binding domain-containing protein